MFDISPQVLMLFFGVIAILYTVLQALSAVKKQDISDLKNEITEVKKTQKETADKLEVSQKEIANKLEENRREDTARLEKNQARIEENRREDTARLEKNQARLESGLNAISIKFDRYLFGKLDKTTTDDSPDSPK